jgi:hypothetical protein
MGEVIATASDDDGPGQSDDELRESAKESAERLLTTIHIYYAYDRLLPILADRLGAHELLESLRTELGDFRGSLWEEISQRDIIDIRPDISVNETLADQEATLALLSLQAAQAHKVATTWNSEDFLKMRARAAESPGSALDASETEKADAFSNYMDIEIPEERIAAARKLTNPWSRSKALNQLANQTKLPNRQDLIQEALTSARDVPEGIDRVRAFTSVARELPEPGRSQSLFEASGWALKIEERQSRADALLLIGREFAEPIRAWLLGEALSAASAIEFPKLRAKVLSELATSLELTSMPALWSQALHRLGTRPRRELVRDLKILEPLITSIIGSEGASVVADEIERVERWFS